jgi:hypothetical protein
MSQSSTLFLGLDGHNESIAVAYVAPDHGAAGPYLGPIGTRPCDLAPRSRQRQSQATHMLFGSAAGPGGYWRYRY